MRDSTSGTDLVTAAGTPEEMRRAVVEEILALAEGDGALFYTVDEGPGQPCAVASSVSVGAAEAAARAVSDLMLRHPQSLPDPRQARPAETASFLESAMIFGSWERFVERPFSQSMREVAGLGDQIRLLAFQGDRYLGWIGAFRRWGAPRFGLRERQRLAPIVPRVVDQLAAADALESTGLPTAPAFVVVRPDGKVEHASEGGHAWLDRAAFRDALAVTVRRIDGGDGEGGPCRLVWRARARVTRLDGADGVRYLVCLEPLATIRRPLVARLSPTQRRVASLVADGLRRKEIAELLELGEETVRSHVREVYRRLEVADRFELQRLLQAEAAR
ncbi:MAG: helix-turn-helix transcriptional regulator [Deltaproteobacteria bacterium]|nr:helix-turn-helix transcriptional regulator [Deltaproteobacteria bacterium]